MTITIALDRDSRPAPRGFTLRAQRFSPFAILSIFCPQPPPQRLFSKAVGELSGMLATTCRRNFIDLARHGLTMRYSQLRMLSQAGRLICALNSISISTTRNKNQNAAAARASA